MQNPNLKPNAREASLDLPFRLSIQSGLFRLYPLELAVERIADAGYEGLELWGGQFHGYMPDLVRCGVGGRLRLDEDRIVAIRELVKRAGLELTCYTPEQCIYPINYLMRDVCPFDGEELCARSRAYMDLSIEAADALGCKRVVVVAPMWQWRKRDHSYERTPKHEAMSVTIQEVERFTRLAEGRGVTVVFEPLTHFDANVVETFEDAAALMEAVPSPNLQLVLDTGHVQVTAAKLHQDALASFRDYVSAFRGRIGWVHVDDNTGTADSHLVPGAGTVDLKGMLGILADGGYRGWISVELAVLGEYVLPEKAERLARQAREHLLSIMPADTASEPTGQAPSPSLRVPGS